MRKRVIDGAADGEQPAEGGWLDLEPLAQLELTSEDPAHPIEAALGGSGAGWRAAAPGPQTIRLIFDRPQPIKRIRLIFREEAQPRTQEFALAWSADGGQSFRELLRQQYNFSPPGTTEQREEYTLNLAGVTVLELKITPDVGGGPAHASLAALQIA